MRVRLGIDPHRDLHRRLAADQHVSAVHRLVNGIQRGHRKRHLDK
jgi:hypothetical protein